MTPDTVETRLGTLNFVDGVPTVVTTQLVYDDLDFMRGTEVFLNFVPACSIEAITWRESMIISHPEYLHQLEVDDQSGLPTALLWTGKNPYRLEFRATEVLLSVNGTEVRSATGGIDYEGAETLQGVQFTGRRSWASSQEGDRCSLSVQIGSVEGHLEYLFRRHGPALTVGLVLCGEPSASLLIRNLTFYTTFGLPAGNWQLNAPGNGLSRDVALGGVTSWTGISPVGGLRGSVLSFTWAAQNEMQACGSGRNSR